MHTRAFLKSLGLLATASPFLSFDFASSLAPVTLRPKALKKGQKVGIVSPSAATADRMEFTYAQEAMEALGLEVKLGENLKNRFGHLAGTDQERAEDLNTMFAAPDPPLKQTMALISGSANMVLRSSALS